MTPARWQKIESLLQAALERRPAERGAFLDEACAADESMRKEVESLLASSDQADEFLKSPVIEGAAALLGDSSQGSTIGPNIGPYSILSKLGSGGMGEVHLARDSRLARNVALKLLDPDLIDNSQQRTRFLREARLASSLDHPNVCTIHEVGEASGRLFIAMQYVEGQTLKQVIDGRPLSLDRLLSISLQVADALSTAHSQGIVHRDIKPGNIIITARGQAKVLDFGLAKLFDRAGANAGELTRTGAVLGTPNYMSPEQARGERTDHRSDIFSFGVVLYEMATGRAPFTAKSQPETLNAVINQPHAPVTELNKDAPSRLSAVVDRALAKDQADRYQSMGEMMDDLREVAQEAKLVGSPGLDGSSVPLVPLSRRATLKWPGHRHAARWFLFLAIGSVVLAGIAGAFYFTRPRPSAPAAAVTRLAMKSIAVLPFKPVVDSSRDEALEMGMADTLITRLSNIKQIIVRPTSAVRNYGGLDQDAMAAGREQKVDVVLDGNIQRSGEHIRVTVRLISVIDGQQLWADKFDEESTDIFRVQDSISERVATALEVKMSGEERRLLMKRYTENSEAYQLYLKGRLYQDAFTEEGLKKGIEYFKQAITLDPDYALAYSGLADSYNYLGNFGFLAPNEAGPEARKAATKALEKDDSLAEAHTSLAYVRMNYDWDWAGADREYRRAIELNPVYSKAHSLYAWYLAAQGRFDEALARIRLTLDLDPLSPNESYHLGWHLYVSRRYDEAIEQLRRTVDRDSTFAEAHRYLGRAYQEKQMYPEAIAEMKTSLKLPGNSSSDLAELGYAYAVAGDRSEALRIIGQLKNLSKREYVSSFGIAAIFTGLGETNEAMVWMDKAYDQRDGWLAGHVKVDPRLDPLRSDPRFADLLRRMGLAP